ncbi:KAT8 regulatory NSL complex subunit 1, partial [Asbolus verrucosus]
QKRSLWKYATSRAAIAGRWTWLQAQISDLEYRIRQHTDLHRQIRRSKGEIQLGGASPPPLNNASTSPTAVNGYRGQLPGSSPISSKTAEGETTTANGTYPDYQCARTRPLLNFRKRRLLQINGLHVVSKKATRPSTVRCGCVQTTAPCAVCTGRTDPTHPRDPPDALSKAERIALVDPAFHPVFSLPEDVSYGIHCEAIMKNPEWQQRSTRMKSLKVLKNDRSDKTVLEHRSKKLDHRKKYNRLLKPSTVSALSAKIKNKIRGRKVGRHSSSSSSSSFRKRTKVTMSHLIDGVDEEVESIGNNSNAAAASNSAVASPSSSPLLQMQAISGYNRRNRANSYDIDNIVIPYSVAAATRVEKLQYKEILTPKWRIADPDFKCDTKNNGAVRNPSQDSDAEDLSEEAVIARHDKSEYEEKKKFLSYLKLPTGHGRSRGHKRTDSLAESSGANTPDPLSPHPADHPESTGSPLTSPPATPLPVEEALPSVSAMRRRTVSQSRFARDREVGREENGTPENVEVAPYDTRTFPLDDDTYEKMLGNMPENHQFKTNARAQDSSDYHLGYLDEKVDSPGSESTESAVGEEDPNDPEWVDMERSRDRHKR